MQQLNPAEISNLIKQRIQDLDVGATAKTEGVIVSVSDGIVQIHGLEEAMYGEMIEFEVVSMVWHLTLSKAQSVRLC